MILELPWIECSDPFETGLAQWLAEQPDRADATKMVVLLGYCHLRYGGARFYEHACGRATSDLRDELMAERQAADDRVKQLTQQLQRVREECAAETERAVDHATSRLRHQLENGAQMDALRQSHEAQLARLRSERDEECHAFKVLYHDAKQRLDEALTGMYAQRVTELQCALQRANDKLGVLQRSNAGKGAWGESLLTDYLRNRFLDWEVTDTSRSKHSCDIWMKRGDERFVAVESKYKASICATDLSKFVTDVDYMGRTNGDALIGAVFVSVRSKNIPGKGELELEYANGRPVLYVGFCGEDDLDGPFLKHCICMLVKVGDMVQGLVKHNADAAAVIHRVRPLLKHAQSMRRTVDGLKAACKKTIDGIAKLETDVREVFETIDSIVSSAS
jgi:hypothetical protein